MAYNIMEIGRNRRYTVLLTIAIVAVLVISCAIIVCSDKKESLGFTVREIDGMTHITMTADYGFDSYLKTGADDLDAFYDYLKDNVTGGKPINGITPINCSAFVIAKDGGTGTYAGRNFDFRYSMPGVIHTSPRDGYASVSTVDLRMFGDTDERVSDMGSDSRYLAVPYLPLDGINEKGVFVCINTVHIKQAVEEDEEGRVPIFYTSALRLILDKAASTEEAVDLLDSFNLRSDVNYHIYVSDSNGDSRTVEVYNGERYVTPTSIMTNHYITEAGPKVPDTDSSVIRYDIIETSIDGVYSMTETQVKDVMVSVQQVNPDLTHYTRWTAIYDTEDLDVVIWICKPGDKGEMDYATPHRYLIPAAV